MLEAAFFPFSLDGNRGGAAAVQQPAERGVKDLSFPHVVVVLKTPGEPEFHLGQAKRKRETTNQGNSRLILPREDEASQKAATKVRFEERTLLPPRPPSPDSYATPSGFHLICYRHPSLPLNLYVYFSVRNTLVLTCKIFSMTASDSLLSTW